MTASPSGAEPTAASDTSLDCDRLVGSAGLAENGSDTGCSGSDDGAHVQTADIATGETDTDDADNAAVTGRRRWVRLAALALFPSMTMALAVGAGWLRWHKLDYDETARARDESVQAARESTVALLSYGADTAARDLGAARDRLSGEFKKSYTSLINDMVIPGARQKHITTVASVPAVASISAEPAHAVALVYVDQSVTIGTDPPTDTASAVRVTLDKVDGRWLISRFDPV